MIESDLLPHLQGYIDGCWTGADSGRRLSVVNPATGAELAAVPAMGRAETDRAIDAADRALAAGASLEQRRRWLEQIEQLLIDNKREIGRILTMEHGKPWGEAQVEVEYAAGFFRFCARHVEALAPRTLEERPKNCSWTIHYRPAGVAGLVTPWNFPIGMIAKKLSAALAADCTCVLKPSAKTPLTMIALFTLLEGGIELVGGCPAPFRQLQVESHHPVPESVAIVDLDRQIEASGVEQHGELNVDPPAARGPHIE